MTDFFFDQPRSLAHRGNSQEYPENTEVSFRSAYDLGVDVIETDVRLMKDGEVLIFHDPDLSRCANDNRLISSLSLKDLKDIDMGYHFSKDRGMTNPHREKGIKPLLLREALNKFPETRFNIDLKDKEKALAIKTAEVIKTAGAEKRVCVGSFHNNIIKAFRRELPDTASSFSQREMISVLLLYRSGWVPNSVKSGQIRAAQIPEFAGPYRMIRPSFIKWCHKNKLAIQVWTINDEKKMKQLFAEGVDGIFSDIPEILVRVCKDYSILAPPRQMSSS